MICTENTIKNTIYSVGTDKTLNLKEKIANVHGSNSEVMKAADKLDEFISSPELKQNGFYWRFFGRVKAGIGNLYPRANGFDITQIIAEFMDEILNGGYIRVLQSLATQSGNRYAVYARQYADRHDVSIGATLLFDPWGGAYQELWHFLVSESAHGLHRGGTSPDPRYSRQTQKMWYDAEKICNWPAIVDENGRAMPLDVAEQQGTLPERIVDTLREMWKRNPVLDGYCGSNRLPGDIPFQIIEDMVDVIIQSRFVLLDEPGRARYSRIINEANRCGIDPFYTVYKRMFANKDWLRPYWNKARRLLYEHSMSLWEARNAGRLADDKSRIPKGVFYRPKRTTTVKPNKKKVPGTVYQSRGRYYWVVADKMKLRPLVDPKTRREVPGSLIKDKGRYYWLVYGRVKRQRLVPKGEKYSTKDKAVAIRIVKNKWNRIKKENPQLADNIIKQTRFNGIATKDKAVAEKVALRMWKDIQKNDPELAAKLSQDNRRKAKDHWNAYIFVNRKLRFLGSFTTETEAGAAYAKAFEQTRGCPIGYHTSSMPRIDKVWPTWEEQKARFERMNEHPRMPVIGESAELEPMIKQMQRVDWLVKNCIVVLDDNSPVASKEVAVESRGEKWYVEIKKQCKRAVIKGSTSIDKDTGRVRITIYGQGFSESRVLTEEVYHIVFEIIRHASPKTFASIKKWYSNRLKHELDPTWMIHEAFAELMVREAEFPESTDLPRNVVNYAQRVFSTRNIVPKWAMKKVLA